MTIFIQVFTLFHVEWGKTAIVADYYLPVIVGYVVLNILGAILVAKDDLGKSLMIETSGGAPGALLARLIFNVQSRNLLAGPVSILIIISHAIYWFVWLRIMNAGPDAFSGQSAGPLVLLWMLAALPYSVAITHDDLDEIPKRIEAGLGVCLILLVASYGEMDDMIHVLRTGKSKHQIIAEEEKRAMEQIRLANEPTAEEKELLERKRIAKERWDYAKAWFAVMEGRREMMQDKLQIGVFGRLNILRDLVESQPDKPLGDIMTEAERKWDEMDALEIKRRQDAENERRNGDSSLAPRY